MLAFIFLGTFCTLMLALTLVRKNFCSLSDFSGFDPIESRRLTNACKTSAGKVCSQDVGQPNAKRRQTSVSIHIFDK